MSVDTEDRNPFGGTSQFGGVLRWKWWTLEIRGGEGAFNSGIRDLPHRKRGSVQGDGGTDGTDRSDRSPVLR